MLILIVEDNEDSYILLREFLKRTFPLVVIEHTNSARLALNKLEDFSFDMVVSDMGLVDLFIGGASVIASAKQQGAFTVIYSGSNAYDFNIRSDFILSKPFNIIQFTKMVALFFKMKRGEINEFS